jgi:hypothetical protein
MMGWLKVTIKQVILVVRKGFELIEEVGNIEFLHL